MLGLGNNGKHLTPHFIKFHIMSINVSAGVGAFPLDTQLSICVHMYVICAYLVGSTACLENYFYGTVCIVR